MFAVEELTKAELAALEAETAEAEKAKLAELDAYVTWAEANGQIPQPEVEDPFLGAF